MKVFSAMVGLAVGASMITAVPTVAEAAGPSTPGAQRQFANTVKVKVTNVIDGDTIEARTSSGKLLYVRTAGINTPEKHHCGYAQAERLLRQQLRKYKNSVEIRYDKARYVRNHASGRYRLSAYIYANGQDTALPLLAAGVALPFNYGNQTHNQNLYGPVTESAAMGKRGLFGSLCNATANPAISIFIKNDGHEARYSDRWLHLRNTSTLPVDLTGWILRVGGRNEREVPAGTVVQPGQALKVRFGGSPSGNEWLWNAVIGQLPVWGNSKYAYGGVYLADRKERIQSWAITPCELSCNRALDGALKLKVMHTPGGPRSWETEYVSITNVSGSVANLSYVNVKIRNLVHELPFGSSLKPQETLYIHPGFGKNRPNHIFLNKDLRLPSPRTDGLAYIATHNGHFLDCFSWGIEKCPV